MHSLRLIAAALLAVGFSFHSPSADTGVPEPIALDFFETKVRPILADHCYACHSEAAEKVKGGLRLDTPAGLSHGGDSGPVVRPGDPDGSLLIRAIRYTDESLQMPPKNKRLTPEQIALLESWVKLGAPMPTASLGKAPVAEDRRSRHWAFQPVRRPDLPEVRQKDWVQEPIDTFILAKLEMKGLQPSPRADKRTLLRRASFDLIGLPPSPEEMAAFLADSSPDAFSKVVERLLASPHYGERWARHWLDIARYADTKGYVFEEERRYPYAYTYRDYVIRAFNEDLPYNQFIRQQLAADQLDLGEDQSPLAALGYLTLGRRFLNNTPDIMDDRIDVVTRGMMGLTVACARCHDHKYDPITTQDYYALYGVFASCSEPEEKPLLNPRSLPRQFPEYQEEHTRRLEELNRFRQTKDAETRTAVRQLSGEYMLAAWDTEHLADPTEAEGLARERKLDPTTVQRWIKKLDSCHNSNDPIFGLWFALAECPEATFLPAAEEILNEWLEGDRDHLELNPAVAEAFAEPCPTSLKEVAERYDGLFTKLEGKWGQAQQQPGPKPLAFPDPDLEALRQVLYAPDSPAIVPDSEITRHYDVPSIQKLRALKRKVEELDATHPGAPARAMALRDNPTPYQPHVFIRGNPNNPGPEVARRFISILAGGRPTPFAKGSGRLELAQAIANPQNPLTARVLVNRVWMHCFGTALVRTPSDFGLRSEPPSHPELLDYLAATFVEEGWSLKTLHRHLVLSSTYQQGSEGDPRSVQIDPSNQLLGRMSRRRLDFEATRDALLVTSGQLNPRAGGQSVDMLTTPFTTRRTIYGFVERQNLPGLFRTFDFASPDTTSPQRFFTTVPQQALFMMNSPFLGGLAESLSRSIRAEVGSCAESRVRALYERIYQREPSPREIELGFDFIQGHASLGMFAAEPIVWQYGYGEFDRATARLKAFSSLPHFVDGAWQGGPVRPDPLLGSIQLKATGGTLGSDARHAAIRRWVAPRDLVLAITGTLRHDDSEGDGIEAWIVSSHAGVLGSWKVRKAKQDAAVERAEVRRGDTIDFIVSAGSDSRGDGFTWIPHLKALTSSGADSDAPTEWDARQDFSGPKPPPPVLDAWGRYAQVLLMANEFVFLD